MQNLLSQIKTKLKNLAHLSDKISPSFKDHARQFRFFFNPKKLKRPSFIRRLSHASIKVFLGKYQGRAEWRDDWTIIVDKWIKFPRQIKYKYKNYVWSPLNPIKYWGALTHIFKKTNKKTNFFHAERSKYWWDGDVYNWTTLDRYAINEPKVVWMDEKFKPRRYQRPKRIQFWFNDSARQNHWMGDFIARTHNIVFKKQGLWSFYRWVPEFILSITFYLPIFILPFFKQIWILIVYKLGFYLSLGLFAILTGSFNLNIIVILYLSCLMLLSKNPIYTLLLLISIFFTMILTLILCQIEFLAMIFLIVYIGAISILFLFVIMMFNLKNLQKNETSFIFYQSVILFCTLLAPKFNLIMYNSIQQHLLNNANVISNNILSTNSLLEEQIKYKQDIFILTDLLYTTNAFAFFLLGFVLLVAMVGAIILALSTNSISDQQS